MNPHSPTLFCYLGLGGGRTVGNEGIKLNLGNGGAGKEDVFSFAFVSHCPILLFIGNKLS